MQLGYAKREHLFPKFFCIFRHIIVTFHGSGIDLKVENSIHQMVKATIGMCRVTAFQHPVDMLHAESHLLMPSHGYRLAIFRINHRSPQAFGKVLFIAFQLSFVTERQTSIAFFLTTQPFDLVMQRIQ